MRTSQALFASFSQTEPLTVTVLTVWQTGGRAKQSTVAVAQSD